LGSYHVADNSWIDWKTLSDFGSFTDWEDLEARLEIKADFSDEDQRGIRLFKQAMGKWRNDTAGHC